MRKLYSILILFVVLSCSNSGQIKSEEQLAIDSLQLQLKLRDNDVLSLEDNVETSDSLVNQYALYIKQIKDNLLEINDKEAFLNKFKDKEKFDKDTLDIINAIQVMAEKIKDNEELISKLNISLDRSKGQNLKFRKEVSALQGLIAKSNREVYYLKEELTSLNSSYNAIFEKYNSQKIKINELNSALDQVAFVIGSKSELLDNGILTKDGGIIGIGKSRKLSNELNTDYLTYSSKSKFKSLTLGFKVVKIITSHPEKSYKLYKQSKGKVDSIVVLDKDIFWRNSKYLVIEVK